MPKIFVMVYGRYDRTGDVIGVALAEDGEALGSHMSSSEAWLRVDLGVDPFTSEAPTGKEHREDYAKHYPNGFEVEWVPDPVNHPGYMAALKLNKERYPE